MKKILSAFLLLCGAGNSMKNLNAFQFDLSPIKEKAFLNPADNRETHVQNVLLSLKYIFYQDKESIPDPKVESQIVSAAYEFFNEDIKTLYFIVEPAKVLVLNSKNNILEQSYEIRDCIFSGFFNFSSVMNRYRELKKEIQADQVEEMLRAVKDTVDALREYYIPEVLKNQ